MIFPKDLQRLYGRIEAFCRDKGMIPGKSGRHMKFPYTLSAKMAQFPLFHYMKHNWIWMYYPFGIFGGFWVFLKIHRLSNSESNVRNWAETQKRIAEKEAAARRH